MQQFRHLLIKMTGCLQRVIKGLLNLVESKPYQPGPPKQQNVSVLGGLLVPVSTWSPSWSQWGIALSKPTEEVGNRCNYSNLPELYYGPPPSSSVAFPTSSLVYAYDSLFIHILSFYLSIYLSIYLSNYLTI